jgi:23S rRNA pseudouridine2605 synthase
MAVPPKTTRAKKTLDRVLSKAGVGSRTEARRWIGERRVAVNGRIVTDPETWIDPGKDAIALDGARLRAASKVYLLVYKPKGYLTTYRDPEGRKTVYDLLPERDRFVFPAGRLDLDTSGLLVMTNDSAFAERLTNPESKVAKTYLVKASTALSDEQLGRLRSGIDLKDGPTCPARVTRVRDAGGRTVFEITITEGRNRQVRRMVEALDAKVLKLVRVGIGELRIGKLPIGKSRPLSDTEVRKLSAPRREPHAPTIRDGGTLDAPVRRAAAPRKPRRGR